MEIEARLQAMGLVLPEEVKVPPEVRLPFASVRRYGSRITISGHGPLQPGGQLAGPFGKVDRDVPVEDAYQSARLTALAILSSLQRELGDLDRVTAWIRVLGFVNVTPEFNRMPAVINGFSDLILELYGPERGKHSRSAIGVASLPFDIPVEVEAEVVVG